MREMREKKIGNYIDTLISLSKTMEKHRPNINKDQENINKIMNIIYKHVFIYLIT